MGIRLLCSSDDNGILHPRSFFVKQSQPMEEHRRKKLLDKSVMLPCPGREFPSVK